MKNKHILVLFLIGMIVTIVGALFKLMHWPGASFALIVGMTFEAVCGVILIIKLLKKGSSEGFWDS